MEILLLYFLVIVLKCDLRLSESSLLIVRHSRITADMRNMFLNITAYPDDDPFNLKDFQTRRLICDKVINAREYNVKVFRDKKDSAPTEGAVEPLPALIKPSNFQRVRRTTRMSRRYLTERKILFETRQASGISKRMKLLECIRDTYVNWFIGFDQEKKQMLLIERKIRNNHGVYTYTILKWTANIEPIAQYNIKFQGVRQHGTLHRYFSDQVRSGIADGEFMSQVPKEMTLCFLSTMEHGRLCSVASETLTKYCPRFFSGIVRRVNYVSLKERCSSKRVELINGKVLKANVVPCSVNRDLKSPQFFILADREEPGAAFVLRPTYRFDPKVPLPPNVKLTGRLEHVAVLTEAQKNKSRIKNEIEMKTKQQALLFEPNEVL